MSKPLDVITKTLVEIDPAGWPGLLHVPEAAVEVVDADISTVGGAVDKVLRVATAPPYLLHLDFYSGHDTARAPRKLRRYNAVLEERHQLLVYSVAVLLRPEADSPQLTGLYELGFPGEPPLIHFRYGVLRVWQQPPAAFLASSLGLVPLAAISAASPTELPGVVEQIHQRLRPRKVRPLALDLWSATAILLGMRHEPAFVHSLLRGVIGMEESTIYQEILARGEAIGLNKGLTKGRQEGRQEGRLEGAQEMLLRVGNKKLGNPSDAVRAAVQAINDQQRLEQLVEQIFEVDSWDQLLGIQRPTRRTRRPPRTNGA